MKITLVRHAQVDEKYHGCYNGHIDIGLSKTGQEQAKKLAEHFKGESFDAVFCSDLIRAKDTLMPFTQVSEAVYTDRLREKSWGRHEGLSFDEICSIEGIRYENFLQWIEALDGERHDKFSKRVEEFFLEYLPSLNKQNVLVMTHSGVIKTFMSLIRDITLEEAFSLSLPYSAHTMYNSNTFSFSDVKPFSI